LGHCGKKVLAPGMRNCKRRFADIDGIAINAANVLPMVDGEAKKV
jgi:hypothetical protein